jgi:NitT/TauT family transport system substrate-binding protein
MRFLIAAAMVGAMAGLSSGASAQLIPFKVGEAAPANTFLAIWMAQDAGFYEAQGLKLEIVHMVGGRESGPALSSGQIQAMHIGMSSVVRANLAGRSLLCIGSLSNIVRNTMFAASDVKTNADLKGRIFGISSAGSESDSLTNLVLRRIGLARADVTVKEIGVDRLTPLRKSEIAATLLGEPQRSDAFALGLRVIADLYAEKIPWLYSGLTVDKAYLQGNRDTLKRFMKATIEGNYLAMSDERRAKAVLARELKLTDAKIIDQGYANFRAETPPNAEIDPAGAENILTSIAPPNANKNLDGYIDMTISTDLRKEGFVEAMEKKYGKK